MIPSLKSLVPASLLAAGVIGYALAQYAPAPLVPSINGGADQVSSLLPGGNPSNPGKVALAGAIASSSKYQNLGVLTTGQTIAIANGTGTAFAQPGGTLAATTLTMMPNPADGQRFCYVSTQTSTALTFSANTGQTVDAGVPTAGVAKTPICVTYVATNATWYVSP